MSRDPQKVSNRPHFPPGRFDTFSPTISEPEMACAGAAGGVTSRCSLGTSPAKPSDIERARASSIETSCLVMRGDLEACIRDMQVCRSLSWISQEMRIQLGRCLYELTAARRMCP